MCYEGCAALGKHMSTSLARKTQSKTIMLPRQHPPRAPLPAARPSHLQLPRLPCDVAVRIAALRTKRWRVAALARLVRVASVALDLPRHAASRAVRAPVQMLRAVGRSVVNRVSRAPPVAVRQRARLFGKRRRCLS
jgi:hypothetical protein